MICYYNIFIVQYFALHPGNFLHDFFIGVTMDDFTSTPQPGNYTLCTPQYNGAATTGQILNLCCDLGVEGRYVWIQVPGTSQQMNICEVEVYQSGQCYI